MTTNSHNPYEQGREYAQQQLSQFGARYVQERAAEFDSHLICNPGQSEWRVEYVRGYRNEASALTALASRKAPR